MTQFEDGLSRLNRQVCDPLHYRPTAKRLAAFAAGAWGRNWPLSTVYFYFIATIWNRGLALAAGIVAAAGLYWLWDEYIHVGEESEDQD